MNNVNRKRKDISWASEAQVLESKNQELSYQLEQANAKLKRAEAAVKAQVAQKHALNVQLNLAEAFCRAKLNQNGALIGALKVKGREVAQLKDLSARRLAEEQRKDYPGFSRTVNAGLAMASGIAAAYLAYNNPDCVYDYLETFDYNPILVEIMPYVSELAAVGAGITAYAVSSFIAPVVLYPAMKLAQAIDYVVKTLLKYVFITVPISLFNFLSDVGHVVGSGAYEYRGTLTLLATVGLIAYYEPEKIVDWIELVFPYIAMVVSSVANSPVAVGLIGVGGMIKKLTDYKTLNINTLQVNNKTFNVRPQIFPSQPREVSDEVFQAELADKVKRGHVLYNQILNGQRDSAQHPATQGEISDIMWFLQLKGEEKAGAFESGSFNESDKYGFLVNFMDSCESVYQRNSSHIKEMQSTAPHRGIDFIAEDYDSSKEEALKTYLDNTLPYGMQTVMIAPMLAKSGYMNGNRVLLKMEGHGAWISPVRDNRAKGPKSRAFQTQDLWQSVVHGLSLCKTQIQNKISGNNNPEGSRKERVPVQLVTRYRALIQELKDLELTFYVKTLEENNPTSTSGGIRVMLKNIEKLTLEEKQIAYYNDQLRIKTKDIIRELNEFCNDIKGSVNYDNNEVRIGDEVIHSRYELSYV